MTIAYRTVKDLKERTPKVLQTAQKQDVVITLRGQPLAIIRKFTPEELESTVLLGSRTVRQRLRQALAAAGEGRTITVDELVERLAAPAR